MHEYSYNAREIRATMLAEELSAALSTKKKFINLDSAIMYVVDYMQDALDTVFCIKEIEKAKMIYQKEFYNVKKYC